MNDDTSDFDGDHKDDVVSDFNVNSYTKVIDSTEDVADYTCFGWWEELSSAFELTLRSWIEEFEHSDLDTFSNTFVGPTESPYIRLYLKPMNSVENHERTKCGLETHFDKDSLPCIAQRLTGYSHFILVEMQIMRSSQTADLVRKRIFSALCVSALAAECFRYPLLAIDFNAMEANQKGILRKEKVYQILYGKHFYSGMKTVSESSQILGYSRREVPSSCSDLAGLIEFFATKRSRSRSHTLSELRVAAHSMYIARLEEEAEDDDGGYSHSAHLGLEYCIGVWWNRFPLSALGRDEVAWSLPPFRASHWRVWINDKSNLYEPSENISRLHKLVELYRAVILNNYNRVPPKNTISIELNFQQSTDISTVVSNVSRILLKSSFEDEDSVAEAHDDERNQSNECLISRVLTDSYCESILNNLSNVEYRILALEKIWNAVVKCLHSLNKQNQRIYGSRSKFTHESTNADLVIDLRTSLLTQKLRFLDGCIAHRHILNAQNSNSKSETRNDDDWNAGWNDGDGWKDDIDKELDLISTLPTKSNGKGQKKELIDANGNPILDENGNVLWEPEVQLLPLTTSDMLRDHMHVDSDKNYELQLESDISAFKAANPGAALVDFLKWFSPADVNAQGTLSTRMQDPLNQWQRLWINSEPRCASDQDLLFDHNAHALSVLEELESWSASTLVFNLLVIQFRQLADSLLNRVNLLQAHHGLSLPRTEKQVREVLYFGNTDLDVVQFDLQNGTNEDSKTQLNVDDKLAQCLKLIEDAERTVFYAESIYNQIGKRSVLLPLIDSLANGDEFVVEDPLIRYELVLATRLDSVTSPNGIIAPSFREIVLEAGCSNHENVVSDRLYVYLSSSNFKFCLKTHLDY